MSEETHQALEDAVAELAEATHLANELKQAQLDAIAAGIPDRVDSVARAVAQAEPSVTKALGRDGVAKFRDELARASSVLAGEVRASIGKIKWPESSGEIGRNRAVASALFEYFYGPRANSLAAVLRKHGYKAPAGLHPYDMFDEKALAPLTDALKKRAKAKDAASRARAADDHDIVDDLWGDGPAAARLPGEPSREW